ncbi:phage holin family protein [Myxococcota bacterium]|nr:phage holin family protein [Myxococcota bacterium]
MVLIRFLVEILAYGGALLLASQLLPGVKVRDFGSAVTIAMVFALLNWLLGWVLWPLAKLLLFLPGLLTCGLLFFLVPLVVNSILLWITDKLMERFEVKGIGPLVGAAAFVAVAQALLNVGRVRGR